MSVWRKCVAEFKGENKEKASFKYFCKEGHQVEREAEICPTCQTTEQEREKLVVRVEPT